MAESGETSSINRFSRDSFIAPTISGVVFFGAQKDLFKYNKIF